MDTSAGRDIYMLGRLYRFNHLPFGLFHRLMAYIFSDLNMVMIAIWKDGLIMSKVCCCIPSTQISSLFLVVIV